MDDEIGSYFASVFVAEADHLGKFVAGIDVKKWEWNLAGIERFLSQAKHYRRIFADGVEHDGASELSDSLAEDGDTLGLKRLKVGKPGRCK
jgi:hypothetical protein